MPRLRLDRNSPLGRFWHWWSGELLAAAPRWLSQSNAGQHALLMEVSAHAIVLRRWQEGTLTELGQVAMQTADHASHGIAFQSLFNKVRQRGETLALWLTPAQALSKEVELPAAASENLRQVLGFEMDRHTPFKADQVYFDYQVLRRDAAKIAVKLVVVPRQTIDGALELLARWGAPVQAVYIASPSQPDAATINLLPSEKRIAAPSRLSKVHVALAALTLVLGLTAVAIPIVIKRQASIALIPLVERAKQLAGSTDDLKRDLEKQAAQYNFMLDKKKSALPVIVLLDELSRLLPDDTWVQQFTLNGKEMQIQGETGSSSKLIGLVESARVFKDANFRSPISKGNAPSSERYHLAAEVKPLPPESIAPAPAAAATPAPAQTGPKEDGKPPAAAPAAPGTSEQAKSAPAPAQPAPPSQPPAGAPATAAAPGQPVAPPAGQAPAAAAGAAAPPQAAPAPLNPAASPNLNLPGSPARPAERKP